METLPRESVSTGATSQRRLPLKKSAAKTGRERFPTSQPAKRQAALRADNRNGLTVLAHRVVQVVEEPVEEGPALGPRSGHLRETPSPQKTAQYKPK